MDITGANKMLSVNEMNNTFITDLFKEWKHKKLSRKIHFANKILGKIGLSVRLTPLISTGTMTSVEQRMNMFHLVSTVLFYQIPGDLAEYIFQSISIMRKFIGGEQMHLICS